VLLNQELIAQLGDALLKCGNIPAKRRCAVKTTVEVDSLF